MNSEHPHEFSVLFDDEKNSNFIMDFNLAENQKNINVGKICSFLISLMNGGLKDMVFEILKDKMEDDDRYKVILEEINRFEDEVKRINDGRYHPLSLGQKL